MTILVVPVVHLAENWLEMVRLNPDYLGQLLVGDYLVYLAYLEVEEEEFVCSELDQQQMPGKPNFDGGFALLAGTHVFFLWPGSPELSLYVDYFHPVAFGSEQVKAVVSLFEQT